jgi:hypothetical protein
MDRQVVNLSSRPLMAPPIVCTNAGPNYPAVETRPLGTGTPTAVGMACPGSEIGAVQDGLTESIPLS